jgi:hypothetical protein
VVRLNCYPNLYLTPAGIARQRDSGGFLLRLQYSMK